MNNIVNNNNPVASGIKNRELFETMPVYKAVATMAVPTIMAQIIVLIYNLADTFFLGQTNDPRMVAAASLVLPVFNLSLSFSGLAGLGGGALISRLLGKKDYEEAGKVYSFSVYFGIIITGLYSLLVLIFINPLLYAVGANDEIIGFARVYTLCVIVFGGIPTVLNNTLSALLRSVGESKRSGFGVMLGGVINIFLDPLFMFVLFPKGQEILGVGVATCLSNCIACLYFIIVIKGLSDTSVLRMQSPGILPTRESIKSIFDVGIPSAIANFMFDLDCMVLNKLMSAYGNLSLAAIGIVLKAERLPLNAGIGLCQGMMPIIAYNYASKDYKRMRDVKTFSMWSGLVFALFSVVLYQMSAENIISLFIKNAETVSLGTYFLKIRCIATPLMFLSFFHVYLFNGFGEGKTSLFLGVMRWAAFNIPMLFIMNLFFKTSGLVWAQTAGDIFTVALSVFMYGMYVRKMGDKT